MGKIKASFLIMAEGSNYDYLFKVSFLSFLARVTALGFVGRLGCQLEMMGALGGSCREAENGGAKGMAGPPRSAQKSGAGRG